MELECERDPFWGVIRRTDEDEDEEGEWKPSQVGRVPLPAIVSTSVNCGNVCVREIIPKWPNPGSPGGELLVNVVEQIRKEKRFGLINEYSKKVKHPSILPPSRFASSHYLDCYVVPECWAGD